MSGGTAYGGEEFLEHGYLRHAWTLHEEVLRVPLIMHAPGLEPARVADAVSTIGDPLLTMNPIPLGAGTEPVSLTPSGQLRVADPSWLE